MMRLQKYLARSGVASRRASEDLIRAGRVSVNGVIAELGSSVDEIQDEVRVDGEVVSLIEEKVVLALYKPTGYVTTMDDPQGRPCVKDLLPKDEYPGIFPVGRLDFDTSGLLLLTNDGELGAKLMHPSFEVDKTYVARVKGDVNSRELNHLREGVDLGDFTTAPAKVKLLDKNGETSTVEVTIHEGKNRQVRRMFKALDHEVLELKRVRYGNITLEGMNPGDLRPLSDTELKALNARISL